MKRILSIMLMMCVLTASAQEKPLTLKDALTFALQNKADAKNAKLDVENAGYQIKEVRAQALPSITANGGLTYNAILQQSALPGEFFGGAAGTFVLVPFGVDWMTTAGVSLNQKLFDMTVFTGLKAAKTTREFYQINAELTDEMVIERVANAYYEVLVAEQQLSVSDSNLVKTVRIRDVVKGQFDNGLAKKIDLDRMNVNVVNLETEKIRSLNEVQLKQAALKFYMGMPVAQPITLAKEEVEVKPVATSEAPSVENRIEYQLLQKQEQLYRYQKKAEQALFYPSLSLNANYNYQGLGNSFPWFAKQADNVFWTDYSAISASLSIPIFNGFGTRAKVQKADVALRKHQVDMEETKLRLNREHADALNVLRNSEAALNSQRENSVLATNVLEDTRNNYVNGLATLTDLLDSENAMTDAQNNYNTALLNYKLAEIQLIKSKGELKNLAQ